MLKVLLCGLLASAAAGPAKPNIIWIMADDMGWGEPGIYPAGSDHGRIATPHLDAFGKSGIQFTNAYAGYTVCAPSRTTLMTGYHSGHFGTQQLPGTQLPDSWTGTTLPEMLKKAGYATAGVGKMAPLNDPTSQGFDFFIGQVDQGLCHNMYPRAVDTGAGTLNVALPLNDKIPDVKNASLQRATTMANPSAFNYTVDITHHHSMHYVENVGGLFRDVAKPFFLYEAFTVPHAGGWGWVNSKAGRAPESGAPVPSDGQYAQETWPAVEKDHAAVITYLDAYVGEMVALLQKLGIEQDTLMFFGSDNGAHLEGGHSYHFFNSTGGLRGHKRSLYEGGVRSPTMARWPGTITPAVSDYAFAFWDIMPTLAEIAGGTADAGIDGVSIVPTLMGQVQPPKEYLYWTWDGSGCEGGSCTGPDTNTAAPPPGWTVEQSNAGLEVYRNAATGELASPKGYKGKSGYGMRVGDWKLVVPHCSSPDMVPSSLDQIEMYHLPTDPFEATNLNATSNAKVQFTTMLAIATKHSVKCSCFQC